MALSNSELQEQLDALETSYNLGALKVKYADREITYRSLDEMVQVINRLKRQLGKNSSGIKMIQASYDGNK